MIRLTIPSIEQDDLQAVQEAVASGFLVQGARVAAFEEAVASYVGVSHAVAVANCTAALHLSLLALNVGPGERVAVTTYSWPATANVIALCGADPVFVDVDPHTFNLNPASLEQVLSCTDVKAVLPVYTFGGMADMVRISEICGNYGVPVVEDAACALGASLQGRQAGTWGIMGCFSFHPRKAITTGEGGIIVTNDPALARKLRTLRNHGLDPEAPAPDFVLPGYNLRMTEFQAALGVTQLAKIERIIERRRALAVRYDSLLEESGVVTPLAIDGSRHVYQSYVVLLPERTRRVRDKLVREMRARGIEVTIGTYHIPLTTYFRNRGGYMPGHFPTTDDIAGRALTLPLHEYLTGDEQEFVVRTLRACLRAE